jgi:hypothetical protein
MDLSYSVTYLHNIILITGSRDWTDAAVIKAALEDLTFFSSMTTYVITGNAPGADSLAEEICVGHPGYVNESYPANWKELGKAAGPIRNRVMLDRALELKELNPQYEITCLAFPLPQSKGTKDMILACYKKGIYGRTYTPDGKYKEWNENRETPLPW